MRNLHLLSSTRRRLIFATGMATGLQLLGQTAARAQITPIRISYGQGSIDPIFTAGYVALKQGYFTGHGLDVNYLNTASGPRTSQLLAAGRILFGATAATAAPALTIAGKPASLIFGFDRRMTYANVIVRKHDFDSGKFRNLKDLSGHQIAVTQRGSVTTLMAAYLMEQAGIAKQVNIQSLGDLATMMEALKTGQIAASMATEAMMSQAIAEGWGVPVFNGFKDEAWNQYIKGDVPGIAVYALNYAIKKRPEVVQAFVDGLVQAQDYINQHTAQEITELVYAYYLRALPKTSVLNTISVYKDKVWLPDNIVTPLAYQKMISIMQAGGQFTQQQLDTVPYERCVNMSFVRKARGLPA